MEETERHQRQRQDDDEPGAKRQRKGKSKGKKVAAAFKVLCPENFAGALIGPGGQMRSAIAEESGAHLLFSDRGDHFPSTECRILTITAEGRPELQRALDKVGEKLVERGCADKAEGKATALLGPEDGEYVFQLAVPSKCAGILIGSSGANIKSLREELNAKVEILKPDWCNHQLAKITGKIEVINAVVGRIVNVLHNDFPLEALQDWAQTRPREDNGDDARKGKGKSKGKSGKGKSSKGQDERRGWDDRQGEERRDSRQGARGDRSSRDAWQDERASPNEWQGTDWKSGDEWRGQDRSQETWSDDSWRDIPNLPSNATPAIVLESARDLTQEFRGDAMSIPHAISSDLPLETIEGLVGRNGERLEHVQKATRTIIVFEDLEGTESHRKMRITGPLCNVYYAHLLMMQRFHHNREQEKEKERSRTEDGEREATIANLQQQLEMLQEKVKAVSSSGSDSTSGGKSGSGAHLAVAAGSGGGKSKGKGKGKGKAKSKPH